MPLPQLRQSAPRESTSQDPTSSTSTTHEQHGGHASKHTKARTRLASHQRPVTTSITETAISLLPIYKHSNSTGSSSGSGSSSENGETSATMFGAAGGLPPLNSSPSPGQDEVLPFPTPEDTRKHAIAPDREVILGFNGVDDIRVAGSGGSNNGTELVHSRLAAADLDTVATAPQVEAAPTSARRAASTASRVDRETGATPKVERLASMEEGAAASTAASEDDRERRKPSNPFLRLMLRFTKKQEESKKKEITLDMLQPSRYKPNNLEQMAEDTKFSKREVRSLYRSFKQECPNGIVDEETFKVVYEKIFPLGDASHYAHLVFSAIDREKTGGITFGDFMEFLSVISKGSTEDKLLWAFTFYDVNHDGVISKEEMLKVTDSIHHLMGSQPPSLGAAAAAASNGQKSGGQGSAPSCSTNASHAHVERIFETMDLNHDGIISVDEFIQYCTSRPEVRDSMLALP